MRANVAVGRRRRGGIRLDRLDVARRSRTEQARRPERHLRLRVVGHRDVARRRVHDLAGRVLYRDAQLHPPGRNVEGRARSAGARPTCRAAASRRGTLLGNTAAEERPAVRRQGGQRHVRDALVAGTPLAGHRRNRLPREGDLRLAVLGARRANPEPRRTAARRFDERGERGGHRGGRFDAGRIGARRILGGVRPVAFPRPHVYAPARDLDVNLVKLARRSAPATSCSR